MLTILLTFACMAVIVVGAWFLFTPFGRSALAVGVLGLLVLEARERASGDR